MLRRSFQLPHFVGNVRFWKLADIEQQEAARNAADTGRTISPPPNSPIVRRVAEPAWQGQCGPAAEAASIAVAEAVHEKDCDALAVAHNLVVANRES
jgi:hypothetical protein